MKRVINFLVGGMIAFTAVAVKAQNVDDSRMNRDIEVAENILGTLIKQELSKRNFFPVEVRGSYRSGYGVTFTVPTDMLIPMIWGRGNNEFVVLDGTPGVYTYSYSTEPEEVAVLEKEAAEKEKVKAQKEQKAAKKEAELADKERAIADQERAERMKVDAPSRARVSGATVRTGNKENRDSLYTATSTRIIEAAKNFLADYGDVLSQLKGDEKIIITNQGEGQRWYFGQNEKRSILMVEASKADMSAFKQGKISRDQFLAKIKITNTESSGKREPDLEIVSSIFNRLYSSDLSKTYYMSGNAYYERLTDFGAIMYMQVYSSNEVRSGLYDMPTVRLNNLTQQERDKKVKELYPVFETELKENILEYGGTVKSLKDNEQLVFNVKLTKCRGCGIPADIEVAVPFSVLKDYNSGKVDKNSALGKMTVKKGAAQ